MTARANTPLNVARQHGRFFLHEIVIVAIFALFPFCLNLFYGFTLDRSDIGLMAGTFSTVFILHLILHMRYVFVRGGRTVNLRGAGLSIVDTRTGNALEIAEEEIVEVNVHVPGPLASGSIPWFPWHEYYYVVVSCGNGQQFLLTCLDMPYYAAKKHASLENARFKESLFCWPPSLMES